VGGSSFVSSSSADDTQSSLLFLRTPEGVAGVSPFVSSLVDYVPSSLPSSVAHEGGSSSDSTAFYDEGSSTTDWSLDAYSSSSRPQAVTLLGSDYEGGGGDSALDAASYEHEGESGAFETTFERFESLGGGTSRSTILTATPARTPRSTSILLCMTRICHLPPRAYAAGLLRLRLQTTQVCRIVFPPSSGSRLKQERANP